MHRVAKFIAVHKLVPILSGDVPANAIRGIENILQKLR